MASSMNVLLRIYALKVIFYDTAHRLNESYKDERILH